MTEKLDPARAPENRGAPPPSGNNRNFFPNPAALLLVALVLLAIGGGVVVYFLGAAGEGATNDAQSGQDAPPLQPTAASVQVPTPTLVPTREPTPLPTPTRTPTPVPTPAPEPTQAPEPKPTPEAAPARIVPDADFGEGFVPLEEGEAELRYPDGSLVGAWFSIQVNTTSRTAGVFFASYDDSDNLINTVKVTRYVRGSLPDNAEIVLYYPDAPARTIEVSGGKISVSYENNLRPYGPSVFSPKTRLNLFLEGFKLKGDVGLVISEQDIDATGLSGKEARFFEIHSASEAGRILKDIDALIRQIERGR